MNHENKTSDKPLRSKKYCAGFVGVIGQPNSGKSTLVNALLGQKLSIVSSKPQTTRKKVLGILSDEDAQMIFVDAPGIIHAPSGLNHFLEQEYKSVVEDSDVLLAILNIDEKKFESLEAVLKIVSEAKKPWMAMITKNDLSQPQRTLILENKIKEYGVSYFSGSALKAPHYLKDDLIPELKRHLPTSVAPLYDPEDLTTLNARDIAEEFVREVCFTQLHEEIPYALAVQVRRFEEASKLIKIFADVIVNKENHKGMVLGQGGKKIKRIGEESREALEKLLGKKIFLELHVRVKKNWMNDPKIMNELGYKKDEPS